MARAFIVERGYTPEIAKGVVHALSDPSSGIPSGMMFTMVKSMAGHWEIGADAGLEALCKSVEQELAKTAGKKTVKLLVMSPNGTEPFECEGLEGMSLKDIAEHGDSDGAKLLAEYIECACSGVMACSTCQVYVHPDWYATVGEPSEAEMDMLELAHEPAETSRLGCQLFLTTEMDGMQLQIPGGANNLFDFIPFE